MLVKRDWKLEQLITIDETMVRCKDKYCPMGQYMPKKLIKQELKVWCTIDGNSKFIYDFDVYYEKDMQSIDGQRLTWTVANLGYKVVKDLTRRIENKEHVIMDNFFTSVELFQDLEQQGIYAIWTMLSKCIGLHPSIINVKEFKKRLLRDLDWMMHSLRRLSFVIWKDKQLVLLLSMHSQSITNGDLMSCSMPHCNRKKRPLIPKSPILMKHSTKMYSVDVANQLHSNFRSHKR